MDYYWIEKEDGTLLETGRRLDVGACWKVNYVDVGFPHISGLNEMIMRMCKPGEKAVKVRLVKVEE